MTINYIFLLDEFIVEETALGIHIKQEKFTYLTETNKFLYLSFMHTLSS